MLLCVAVTDAKRKSRQCRPNLSLHHLQEAHCKGTARRAVPVEILRKSTQMFDRLHPISLATDKLPFKVIQRHQKEQFDKPHSDCWR